MGSLLLGVNLAAEVVSSYKLYLYRPVCKEAFVRQEQHTVGNNDSYSITGDEDLAVQELGIALSGTLHIQDSYEPIDLNLASNESGTYKQEVQPLHMGTGLSENLTTCQPIVNEEPLITAVHIECLLKDEDSTEPCVIDLPTPKLVSSMKGSHEKQGLPVKSKLRVTWAPDVYDPPVTSDSRTVKDYRQLFKYRKDQNKHKQTHSKSKSLRGSSGDKKHAHRRSTSTLIDPRFLRLRTLNGPVSSGGLGRSKAEVVVDYAARRQEPRIGSSCYLEPSTQACLSVAEAS